jgi:hypothetical protein
MLLGTTSTTAPRYVGVFLTINILVSVAILLSWTANIRASQSKRTGGYVILATVGQRGLLLGTIFLPSE